MRGADECGCTQSTPGKGEKQAVRWPGEVARSWRDARVALTGTKTKTKKGQDGAVLATRGRRQRRKRTGEKDAFGMEKRKD